MAADVWGDFLNISGVDDVVADNAAVKIEVAGSVISVSGVADDTELTVYSLNGSPMYSGLSHNIEVPNAGMYVVRVAGKSQKVLVP